jgi:hypothetical protein
LWQVSGTAGVMPRLGVRRALAMRVAVVSVIVTTAAAVVTTPVTAHAGVGAAGTPRHRLPQVTQHAGGAVLRRRLYVIGGEDARSPLRTVQRYDPHTNRWGRRARLPARRSHVGAVAADGFVFAIGGTAPDRSPSRSLFRYDPSADRWRERAPMPVALSGVAASGALANDRKTIFVFGGRDRGNVARRSTLAYDIATDDWSTLAPMPGSLADASAVRVGGTIDVLGGIDGGGAASTAVLSYDIATNTWTSLSPMRSNAFGPIGAVVGRDGRIYAIGLDWSGRRVDAYDPAADAWTGSPPNLKRAQAFPATGRVGRRIYAAGGNPGSLTLSSSTLESLRVT